ncbi:MAG: hypothetical protein K2H30_04960 [Clostridia bacterium]|nr:hypothetical protein [Clostridia bacterium]MDE7265710.1 hypothetical protein [Clostridia bacterium]
MSLVFFDIECASVRKTVAKICVFGYVVCDENFNILKKEDILINPRGEFHLTDRKGDKGIVLPYSYEEFKKYPAFPKVYGYIKELLEDKDNIILGHATMNDVKYLNLETKRFRLPSFRFSFSDSQLIYMTYISDYSHQFGLEHIANDLGVDFVPHRAADDAYATMRVVEAMCKAKGCGYSELVKQLRVTEGRISNYQIHAPTSHGFKAHHAKINELKQQRAKTRTKFANYITRKRPFSGGKFAGKTFTFAREIEDDLPLAESMADAVFKSGGNYSFHVTKSDFYVTFQGDDSPRSQNAQKLKGVTVLDVAGFKELLNG